MRRREFIAGAATTAMLPKAIRAQPANAVRRVAMLVAEANQDDPFYEGRIAGMREGLRGLGWMEGQNLILDIHRTSPKATEVRKLSPRGKQPVHPISGHRPISRLR